MSIPFLPLLRRLAWAVPVLSILANLALVVWTVRLVSDNRSLEDSRASIQRTLDQALAERGEISARLDEASKKAEALRAEVEKLRGEAGTVDERIAAAERTAAEANEEKTYLEDILIYQNREIEALRKSAGADVQELAKKLLDREEENRRLQIENAQLRQRVTSGAESPAVDLGVVRVGSEETSEPAPAQRPARRQGRVLAINDDHGFVVVNLGRVDGVRDDTPLFLSKADEVVATLSVVEARDVMSACNVKSIKTGVRIEINDPVSLKKG